MATDHDPQLGGEDRVQGSGSEPHLSDHVAVMRHLEDLRYWRTRQAAARDIIAYGPRAVPGLLDALYDQNVGTRLHAVEALIEIGDRGVQEGLISALWDEHPLMRQAAAHGLGQLGTEKAINGLLRVLDDPEVWVRKEAALALGRIAGREFGVAKRVVPALLDCSTDSSIVRGAVMDSLSAAGRSAIPPLREGLHHAQWIVRRCAAAALVNLGEAAVPTLEQALDSDDSGVKRIAAWALQRVAVMQ